tara:strand:+ start:493 stop:768 length:276 start_codon:yes stop_codon:yes gene_type:complete
MKTETKLVYISFRKYADNGVSYHVFAENMREHLDKDADYAFLCEIVIPVVSGADVARLGIDKLDKEIADHCVAIEAIKVQKQQFLALENGE